MKIDRKGGKGGRKGREREGVKVERKGGGNKIYWRRGGERGMR